MDNKELLTQFFKEVWNAGDFSRLVDFINDPYLVGTDAYDPWSGQTINHEVFKERVMYSRNAFAGLTFGIKQLLLDENKLTVTWDMAGTFTGDLPNLKATGQDFKVPGISIYSVSESKLSGHEQVFDQLGFLIQTGAIAQIMG